MDFFNKPESPKDEPITNLPVGLTSTLKLVLKLFSIENFPSKIGGLPTWIIPIPDSFDNNFFICSCGKPLSFLLQIYCPLEENPNCFHRILYMNY